MKEKRTHKIFESVGSGWRIRDVLSFLRAGIFAVNVNICRDVKEAPDVGTAAAMALKRDVNVCT